MSRQWEQPRQQLGSLLGWVHPERGMQYVNTNKFLPELPPTNLGTLPMPRLDHQSPIWTSDRDPSRALSLAEALTVQLISIEADLDNLPHHALASSTASIREQTCNSTWCTCPFERNAVNTVSGVADHETRLGEPKLSTIRALAATSLDCVSSLTMPSK